MRQVSKIGITALGAAFMVTAIAAGCASTQLRTETSTSGIAAAEEVGAANVPQASLHLQLAKEELEYAKKLAANDQNEEAASMLLRSEADAELAIALAHGDAEKKEAEEAMERVHQLVINNP